MALVVALIIVEVGTPFLEAWWLPVDIKSTGDGPQMKGYGERGTEIWGVFC